MGEIAIIVDANDSSIRSLVAEFVDLFDEMGHQNSFSRTRNTMNPKTDAFRRASLPIQGTVASSYPFQDRNLFVPDDEVEKDRYAEAIDTLLGAGFLE